MPIRDLLYPLRIVSQIIKLPKESQHRSVVEQSITSELDTLKTNVRALTEAIEAQKAASEDLTKLVRTLDSKVSDLKHTSAAVETVQVKGDSVAINNTIADNHSLDLFYKQFEDRFRGSEEDIRLRVAEYKPQFDALSKKLRKLPIIDLGCGRGEFLSFAKDNKLKAVGIDMNYDMVERAKSLGLTAHQTDAVSYMSKQKTGSIAAITGFHIVEHIPFEILMNLLEECYRSIAPGGFALFETPNPKNVTIGACNFYIDPSHIKPLPPELLSFALESVGFKTEIITKHPSKENIHHEDQAVEAMMHVVYGPQDYAVVATKL